MIYEFKQQSSTGGTDPQAVGEALQELRNKHDGIEPVEVVKMAKRKTSPLHEYFEWDNTVAGAKWRVDQARRLIKAIVIIDPDTQVEEPAFVNVKIDGVQYYQSTHIALHNADEWESAVHEIASQIARLTNTFNKLLTIAEGSKGAKILHINRARKALVSAENSFKKAI